MSEESARTTEDTPQAVAELEPLNVFFRLTIFGGAVFIITILAVSASLFSEQQAAPAKFFNRHGTTLILWEVGITLVCGFLAMFVDRRAALKQRKSHDAVGSK